MAKPGPDNKCHRASKNGKLKCKGDDLLTECQNWCKELDIREEQDLLEILDLKLFKG